MYGVIASIFAIIHSFGAIPSPSPYPPNHTHE